MVSGETSYCKMVTGLKCLFEWFGGKISYKMVRRFQCLFEWLKVFFYYKMVKGLKCLLEWFRGSFLTMKWLEDWNAYLNG